MLKKITAITQAASSTSNAASLSRRGAALPGRRIDFLENVFTQKLHMEIWSLARH